MPTILSEAPIVFGSRSKIIEELCDLLEKKLTLFQPRPFSFVAANGDEITEENRYIYPASEIFAEQKLRTKVQEFARQEIPLYLRDLRAVLMAEDYMVVNLEHLRFVLRVRIMEDRKGYALTPHRDSSDTLFSFIVQMNSENNKTSIYRLDSAIKIKINESKADRKLICQEIILGKYPSAKITWRESQFKRGLSCWTDLSKFFRFEVSEDQIFLMEYGIKELDASSNNVYAIHNVLPHPPMIKTSRYEVCNERNYHGVSPVTKESRKLIIMDLLAGKEDLSIFNLNQAARDFGSYYLYFGAEFTSRYRQLLR